MAGRAARAADRASPGAALVYDHAFPASAVSPMLHRPFRETWLACPQRAGIPPRLRPWLTDPASLTARIRARCSAFRVRVLRQCAGSLHPDERRLLGLRAGETALLREVLLIADGRPVVFARSVVARRDLRGGWLRLWRGIGSRPLGAALFSDRRISRLPLACARIGVTDRRYHLARRSLAGDAVLPPALWARRSVFRLHGRSLMVSEFFLPAILELPDDPL